MSVTAQALAWPEASDFAELSDAGNRYNELLEEVRRAYSRLLDAECAPSLKDGAPAPTLADVGKLSQVCARVGLEIGALQMELDALNRMAAVAPFEVGEAK